MLNIISNLRKIPILKKTNIFTMTLSASMKLSYPELASPHQQQRIVITAMKPEEHQPQLIPVLRLYHHR